MTPHPDVSARHLLPACSTSHASRPTVSPTIGAPVEAIPQSGCPIERAQSRRSLRLRSFCFGRRLFAMPHTHEVDPRRRIAISGAIAALGGLTLLPSRAAPAASRALAVPERTGGMALDQALALRRSVRSYVAQPLALAAVSQLLWAARGRPMPGVNAPPLPPARSIRSNSTCSRHGWQVWPQECIATCRQRTRFSRQSQRRRRRLCSRRRWANRP